VKIIIVIDLAPLQGSPVPIVSLHHLIANPPPDGFCAVPVTAESPLIGRHTFQQPLRTRSTARFLHPLRLRVTAICLAGLEHGARHVVADQLGQVGGALQQAVKIDAGV